MATMSGNTVLLAALCSRLIVFAMQVLFNYIVPDSQPDVFNPRRPNVTGLADKVVEFSLEGYRRWDSLYLLHIAQYGYTYENCLAFFPGFPLLVRAVASSIFAPLQGSMRPDNIILLSAAGFNLAAFLAAAWYLHRLARELLGKGNHSWFAAMLFCFNPCSIFMSAAYTESLFAAASFAHMYHIEKREYFRATAALALATFTRSNGLPLLGFPLYSAFHILVTADPHRSYLNITQRWMKVSCCVLYGCLPFVIFQYIAFMLYCKRRHLQMPEEVKNYGRERGYHIPSDSPSAWCHWTLPLAYTYIQKTHWNVGFLNYYELKQLPNFLLAAPVIVLSAKSITSYLFKMRDALLERRALREWMDSREVRYLPYCLHLLFLVVYSVANVHIQVLTRMVYSSSPLIYLFLARQVSQYFLLRTGSLAIKLVMAHFVGYFVLGTFLHCNFLPWT